MLSRVTIRGTKWLTDSSGKEVLQIDEPHALVQTAGYLKYKMAKSESSGIYFRGQRKIYDGLIPTLYRNITSTSAQSKRHQKLTEAISSFRSRASILQDMGAHAHEPLLQHYGIQTTWIDLVDNVWVALWFACHRALSIGKNNEFIHFERRAVHDGDEYAYILLVRADLHRRNKDKPGYYFGDNTELIDLRMAAPSVFLRPHAQHGMLFRRKGAVGGRDLDYRQNIAGIVRVGLAKALDWLGTGKMVNTHSLFPPPYYDNGYQILLTCGASFDPSVGAIHHVGA